jgi:hypothetical protein
MKTDISMTAKSQGVCLLLNWQGIIPLFDGKSLHASNEVI